MFIAVQNALKPQSVRHACFQINYHSRHTEELAENAQRNTNSKSDEYLKFKGYLCLEIGYDQKIDVIELIENEEKYIDTYCKKDLYGNDRVIITRLN